MLYLIEPYKRDLILQKRLPRGKHWCPLNVISWDFGTDMRSYDLNFIRVKSIKNKYRLYRDGFKDVYV